MCKGVCLGGGGRTFYLDALREALPRVMEGGSLASVLEHCMYCGMSLGRVGLDFRGLLCPIFEACVRNTFAANVKVPPHSWPHACLPAGFSPSDVFARGFKNASCALACQPACAQTVCLASPASLSSSLFLCSPPSISVVMCDYLCVQVRPTRVSPSVPLTHVDPLVPPKPDTSAAIRAPPFAT